MDLLVGVGRWKDLSAGSVIRKGTLLWGQIHFKILIRETGMASLLTKYFTAPALHSNPEMKSQFHSFFNHILICFVFSLHITVNIIFIYLFSKRGQSFPFPYYMGALMVRAQYKDSSTVLAAIKNIHYLVNGD